MDFLGGDSDSEVDFTINEKYAKRYEKWRRGEEIQKLKDKYGDVEDSESSSSEEDENGKELTEDVEKQFFKTLSCLKQKNPKIYDQNIRFFEENQQSEESKPVKKKTEPSPLTVAGYQRKVLLETEGQLDDRDADDVKSFELMNSHDQENDIKQSFKDILKDSDNEDEEQWGNLFTKRVKTAEEVEKEEEDYRKWLAGEIEKIENSQVKDEFKGLHDYWADPKLDEGEKFLRDYILNKRYLEHEDKNRIPSYDEIVHDSDSNLSADENRINEQDEFERKYNFRFEEPDREFIKRYPRTMEQSMRKKDEKRKKHREEVKQRKQAERSKKDEELKRLKTLKKKEIMEKIKKLQHITGNEDISFQTGDLEGDFDPEEHDRRMSQIFNDDYYGAGDDEEKPEFPDHDEELEIENWDNWERPNQEEEELHCEDPGFNMDCDYDPTKKKELQKELIENSRRRKRRKKSKFAEALEREKPPFDPKDKTYEQYIDEYYALDYEDLIGDIPCRFKYRKVVPNDFGLSIEEILNAEDQELNRWVSIKKITRRLPEHVEKYDVKAYRRKAANFHKKAKCFPSLYGPKHAEGEQQQFGVEPYQDLNELEEKSAEYSNERQSDGLIESVNTAENSEPKAKRKKKKKKNNRTNNPGSDTEQPVVYEEVGKENKVRPPIRDVTVEEPTKKKKKKWKIEDVGSAESGQRNEVLCSENGTDVPVERGKKKKRRKKSADEKPIQRTGNECMKFDAPPDLKKRKAKLSEETNNVLSKKRKFNHNDQKNESFCNISDERLRSYGLNPKKYKNKLKYKNKNKR